MTALEELSFPELIARAARESARQAVEAYALRHPAHPPSPVVGTEELGRILGVKTAAAQKMLAQGRIPGGFQIPGVRGWRIRRVDLELFFEKAAHGDAA